RGALRLAARPAARREARAAGAAARLRAGLDLAARQRPAAPAGLSSSTPGDGSTPVLPAPPLRARDAAQPRDQAAPATPRRARAARRRRGLLPDRERAAALRGAVRGVRRTARGVPGGGVALRGD